MSSRRRTRRKFRKIERITVISLKNKETKTIFNLTAEWAINIILIVLQGALIAVMSALGAGRDGTYWIIFGCLSVSFVFFLFMLLYKAYRARLTLVTLSRDALVFRRAFKRVRVEAEDLVVALCDSGKPGSKFKLAMVYDKADPNGGFLLEVSNRKCFGKIADFAPRILLTFVAACTDGDVLEKLKATSAQDVVEYIQRELDAREANAHPAPTAPSKKKKRKKKKK